MKTNTLLSITVLGLLLWASCIQANGSDSHQAETQEDTPKETTEETPGEEEETEEAPKKEKTTEIEEEKDVMVLHINNFARALSENQYVLVEFYAPWCGHCEKLEPIYAEVAGKLKEKGSAIRLAKVDAIEETELSEEFKVLGFPILKLITNGDRTNPVEFAGQRTVEGIIQWLERRTGPGAPVLDSADSAAQFIDANNITVVGFFKDLDSKSAKVFKDVALDMNTELAVTASPEVFQKYEVKANSVVLFKKFDEGRADLSLSEEEELTKENLTSFITKNSLELIIPFNEMNAQKIFTCGIKLHSLMFINSTVETQKALVNEMRAVAKEFKDKILFIVIDITTIQSDVLDYFGVSVSDAPTSRLFDMVTGKKFTSASGDLTSNSLRQLCQDVVAGTAKAYYRSQEIPEDWNKGPVKVLVGKNFKSVALDPTKNVFVEFYAPWCGHCKELTPIWEQLGEKYADKDDIIIAKMDATANEVESIEIKGFPTLKYFPADGKEVVDYTGERDLETLSKFLDDGGVLPEVESDEGESEEDDSTDHEEASESAEVPTNITSKDEL